MLSGMGKTPFGGLLRALMPLVSGETNLASVWNCDAKRMLHLSSVNCDTSHWMDYNKKIFPPQAPGEERRPAYVCHVRENIHYSPWKMQWVAAMVRGMTVDEAVKQLSFLNKKGGPILKEVILEAQRMAVEDHNVEYKSNLWVAESFVGKGIVIKGMRRCARKRVGRIEYFHSHYFVRLEEGTPPKHYYPAPKTGPEMLEAYMKELRDRQILGTI